MILDLRMENSKIHVVKTLEITCVGRKCAPEHLRN